MGICACSAKACRMMERRKPRSAPALRSVNHTLDMKPRYSCVPANNPMQDLYMLQQLGVLQELESQWQYACFQGMA